MNLNLISIVNMYVYMYMYRKMFNRCFLSSLYCILKMKEYLDDFFSWQLFLFTIMLCLFFTFSFPWFDHIRRLWLTKCRQKDTSEVKMNEQFKVTLDV